MTRPLSVLRNRSSRGGLPGRLGDDPLRPRQGRARPPGRRTPRPAARCASGRRRPRAPRADRASTCSATSCAASSGVLAGQLEVERDLAPVDGSITDRLWISRTRGTLSAAARIGSRMIGLLGVGSTWTTTSLPGSARFTAASTRSAAAWPCSDGGARLDAERRPRNARPPPGAAGGGAALRPARGVDGGARAASASAGERSMSTSTLRRISLAAAARTSRATNSAASESAGRPPARRRSGRPAPRGCRRSRSRSGGRWRQRRAPVRARGAQETTCVERRSRARPRRRRTPTSRRRRRAPPDLRAVRTARRHRRR